MFVDVHGAAEDPFFRLLNLRTSHPLTARLSADAIRSFRDFNLFDPPALKYSSIHARSMVSFALACSRLLLPATTYCLGYTRSNLTPLPPPKVSKRQMLINQSALQGKRKKSSRTPQGPRKVRDLSYTMTLFFAEHRI